MLKTVRGLAFTFSILVASWGLAQSTIEYTHDDEVLMIGKQSSFYEDAGHQYTLSTLIEKPQLFKPLPEEVPNFGNTQSVIWCRFTVHNKTGETLYLEFRKAMFDEVEFFWPDTSGAYKSALTGSAFARSTREIDDNFFLFTIPQRTEPQTYYLRTKSLSNISFPVGIGTARHMFAKHRDEEFLYGLFLGLIVTLIIYNLFILLATRDRTYFYYIAYLFLSVALYDMSAIGFGAEFLWKDLLVGNRYYVLSDILIGTAVFVNLLFLDLFLDLRRKLPGVHAVNRWIYLAIVLVVVLNALQITNHLPLTQTIIIGSALFNLYIIVLAYYRKLQRARFLLVGWSLYIASIIFYELYIVGIVPYSELVMNSIPMGSSFEALFFSFALADRIRELRVDKLRAKEETLTLIREQNTKLESMVYERTLEISTQNEEMAAQNEELLTLQDQINEQNEDLEKRNRELAEAKKIIEAQHQQLQAHAQSLEERIRMKANDLVQSNRELVRQNNQLQQFSFITAHNLRAPVARVLGLIQVLEISATEAERKEVLDNIYKTGTDLDQVIKDLTYILDIRKGSSENFEHVAISDTVLLTKTLLQGEIERNLVTFETRLHEKHVVYGLKPYLESIVYNLISNAIKYRSPDRVPTIVVSTEHVQHQIKLCVQDNGLGIDLKTYGDKIFGMYKRFHFHTEGKGIGLHLVKTQVEAMGGTISLTSEPGKGTTFEITLPTQPAG